MGKVIITRHFLYLLLFLSLATLTISAVAKSAVAEPTVDFHQQPLTIAVNKTTYPYQFVDKQGQVSGLMIDLWRLWAKKQHVEIKFIPLTWSKTLAQVKSGAIDIHAGLAITEARQQSFGFSSTLFPLNNYVYINQNLINIENIKQLAPYSIGVVENSAHIANLKKLTPELSIKTYPSRTAKYNAAIKGEILAFMGIDKLSKKYVDYKIIKQLFPHSKRILYSQWQYAVATSKKNKLLLAFIEQGFAKISLEEKSAIERKWLGLDKQNDTLLLAFSPQIPPYMTLSPMGKPQGLFVDIWRLWSKYTGQKIDFIAENLVASAALVKQKSADVMIAYPESKLVNTGLKKAWNIYQAKSQVYVSSKYPNIQKLADLNGHTLGMFVTSPYKITLEQQYPDIEMRYFSDLSVLVHAAEVGEIDAMVSSTDIMNLRLNRANLQSSFYRLEQPVFTSDLYSLISNDNDRLAEIISDGFKKIPFSDLIAVEEKWLPNKKSYFEQRKDLVELSQQEKTWLAKGKLINVGVVKGWKPMEYVDEHGQLGGINVDIMKLVAKRTKLKLNFKVFNNWKDLYNALLEHKIALAGSITPTKERKKKLFFTKPYWELPWVILHRQTLGKQSSLKDFYGKKIAVAKGYQLIDVITSEYPQISLMLVDATQDGMVAVEQGLVDGMLEPLVIASELLKKESTVALMISVMDDLEWDRTHMAVRKDWPELKSIIDKGILSISKIKKQEIYEKWFNVNINTGFDKKIVYRVALQASILILVVIAIIVIWNRRLFREVSRRKALEEKMKHMATHDELTGLGNRALLKDRLNNLIGLHQRQNLQMAVLFIDLDGFKTINDTYGHDVGDELLIQLSGRLKTSIRTSDSLVRFGGDEFVLLLTGLNQGNEAAFIAEKILFLLKTPFELSVVTTCIGCSIGIALYPGDGTTDTELLKVADTLMYKVKAQGKNNYIFNSEIK